MAKTSKSAAARKPKAASPETAPRVSPSGVRVRMYRQGLGDCFLLTFPGRGDEPVFMLIDCGVLKRTPDGDGRIRRVAEDIFETTGGHLHILVATHEHWDHVGGFLQAREIFERMRIDDVWLPWTEDPNDVSARELQWHRRSRNKNLSLATTLLKQKTPADAPSEAAPEPRVRVGTTAEAFAQAGAFGKGRRFLRPGQPPMPLPGVDDVRVFVLGPPAPPSLDAARRATAARKMAESPEEAFFAAVRAAHTGWKEPLPDTAMPFDRSVQVPVNDAEDDPFFSEMYLSPHAESWRQIDPDWLQFAGPLARTYEADINNLSLVLAIELVESGRVLFFPADAQEESWQSWHDLAWTVRATDGSLARITAADLLRRTVLYKVSHHGSDPGNPREGGLDLMASPELIALLPVNAKIAEKMRWAMPFPAVLARLQELTQKRVIRVDTGVPADASIPGVSVRDLSIDVAISRAARGHEDLARRIEEALRGPVLDNYEGYATARLLGDGGGAIDSLAPAAAAGSGSRWHPSRPRASPRNGS